MNQGIVMQNVNNIFDDNDAIKHQSLESATNLL